MPQPLSVSTVVLGFADSPHSADAATPQRRGGDVIERRYYADERHSRYRFAADGHPLADGAGRLCITYLLGGERAAQRAKELLAELDGGAALPPGATLRFARAYRLMRTFSERALGLASEQVPFIAHTGMQVACAVLARDAIAEATQWWIDVHYPDCVTVPGWRGVLSLEPLGAEGNGELTHFFLIDGNVDRTQAAMNELVVGWRASGRSPAPRGISKRIFSAPYLRIDKGDSE